MFLDVVKVVVGDDYDDGDGDNGGDYGGGGGGGDGSICLSWSIFKDVLMKMNLKVKNR